VQKIKLTPNEANPWHAEQKAVGWTTVERTGRYLLGNGELKYVAFSLDKWRMGLRGLP